MNMLFVNWYLVTSGKLEILEYIIRLILGSHENLIIFEPVFPLVFKIF